MNAKKNMKSRFQRALILLLIVLAIAHCSNIAPDMSADDLSIPASRMPTWDAGVRGGIPDVPNRVNVLDFGAKGDGTTDDTAALKAAISACPTPGAVYLPAGSYVIKGHIDMPSGVVIRGAGIDKTHLLSEPNGANTFQIFGTAGNFVQLTGTAPKGTEQVSVADASSFSVGQSAQIVMDNEDFMGTVRFDNCRGQTVKIEAISGNSLTFDIPLRLEYPFGANPRIRPLTPKQDVGFEDFHVKQVVNDGTSSVFHFNVAENCWVKNVESEMTARYHIYINNSRYITVRDSVMHHAYNYDGGGYGYGVLLFGRATDCLRLPGGPHLDVPPHCVHVDHRLRNRDSTTRHLPGPARGIESHDRGSARLVPGPSGCDPPGEHHPQHHLPPGRIFQPQADAPIRPSRQCRICDPRISSGSSLLEGPRSPKTRTQQSLIGRSYVFVYIDRIMSKTCAQGQRLGSKDSIER